jgi:DNA-binding HxlR family transcriptional regulator
MVSKRTYGEACAAAHALDLVGERWALLVVRELLLGPRRFTDLRAGLPGISSNVLSERLRELEQFGVVRKKRLPPPAASKVYQLTQWGMELEPVISALGRWGARSPLRPREAPMSTGAFVLALRTMFDPGRAGGQEASYELRIGEESFRAVVEDGRFGITRGSMEEPDATIEAGVGALAALVFEGRSLEEALRSGEVRVEGDRRAVESFLTLFPLPEPAERVPRDT